MEEQHSAEKRLVFPWLTLEVVLYGAVLLLALALRLGGLGMRLLNAGEADQAWQAWQLVQGREPVGPYSPLLLTGQALLFALGEGSDAFARLWPALFGSALVLTPYLLRGRLGRVGSLAAALALALSPTLVYSSRYADGGMALVACTLGSTALWLAYRQERRTGYLWAAAVLDALSLLADRRIVGVIIVFVLAWAIEQVFFARNLFAADPDHPIPWKRYALILGGVLFLVAVALFVNPFGLAAWADFPARWGAHLAPVVNGQPWYYPLAALLLYEPLLLVFGLIGALDLLIRKDEAAILAWMAVGFLLLAVFSGGRDAGDVALVCAPLALLVGRAAENGVNHWRQEARREREGVFVGVALVILVYVAFQTVLYARALYIGHADAGQFLWLWLLAVALMMVLIGLFLAWFGPWPTWRAVSATLAIFLLLVSFSAAVNLNFRRANDPRELHVRVASDEGIRDAIEVMQRISAQRRGYPISIAVTVEGSLGPLWQWYLRDWEQVEVVDALTADVHTPLVLASEAQSSPILGDGYTGQDFVVRRWWEPALLASNDQLSWLLYRHSVTIPIKLDKVILWVKAD